MRDETCRNRPIVVNYLEIDPVLVGGDHNVLLSHVCMSPKDGLRKLNIDVHRYPPGGKSNPNIHEVLEQAYLILEGEGEVILDGVSQDVSPVPTSSYPTYVARYQKP
jgi:uncharacterized cupin superfamily protein